MRRRQVRDRARAPDLHPALPAHGCLERRESAEARSTRSAAQRKLRPRVPQEVDGASCSVGGENGRCERFPPRTMSVTRCRTPNPLLWQKPPTSSISGCSSSMCDEPERHRLEKGATEEHDSNRASERCVRKLPCRTRRTAAAEGLSATSGLCADWLTRLPATDFRERGEGLARTAIPRKQLRPFERGCLQPSADRCHP